MTGLLVSVRDVTEAAAAFRGGASIIDVKEPDRGPLGAASIDSILAIANFIGPRAPVSVALGDLLDPPEFELAALTSVSFAKIGLAGMADFADWQSQLTQMWKQLPAHCQAVAVAYADHSQAVSPPIHDVLSMCIENRARYLLVDTFDKSKHLLQHLGVSQLESMLANATRHGIQVVLAGSITAEHLASLPTIRPTYVGVRGAVCVGNRSGRVSQAKVAHLRHAITTWTDKRNEQERCKVQPKMPTVQEIS